MKKIGEIIIVIITVLNIPILLHFISEEIYNNNLKTIWIFSMGIALILSVTQLNFKFNSSINRLFRKLRYHIFKSKNIASVLTIQIVIIIILFLINNSKVQVNIIILSFGINLIALNLLVLVGKIVSTDSKELLLHNTETGKIYLLKNNKLRHIPDPETFDLFGFRWSDPIYINKKELSSYKIEAPITSIKDMKILNFHGAIYGVVNEKLKHIPDMKTLNYILDLRLNKKKEIVKDLEGYEIDKPFNSYKT